MSMTKAVPLRKLLVACTAAAAAAGCTTTPTEQPKPGTVAMQELSQSLKVAATRAVDARVALSRMQPVSAVNAVDSGVKTPMSATSLVDIDFTGPVENAVKIITGSVGWRYNESGKKRADVLVNLRHSKTDALTILRDIGLQCEAKCDLHVEIQQGGQSSVELIFRD